jgi:hypothetical protein
LSKTIATAGKSTPSGGFGMIFRPTQPHQEQNVLNSSDISGRLFQILPGLISKRLETLGKSFFASAYMIAPKVIGR